MQVDAEDDANLLNRYDFLGLRQSESLEADCFNLAIFRVSELFDDLWVLVAAQEEVQQNVERKAELVLQLVLAVIVLSVDLLNFVDQDLNHSDRPLQSFSLLQSLASCFLLEAESFF